MKRTILTAALALVVGGAAQAQDENPYHYVVRQQMEQQLREARSLATQMQIWHDHSDYSRDQLEQLINGAANNAQWLKTLEALDEE
jgi:hypothetical protein